MRIAALLLVICFSSLGFAQQETLLGSKEIEHGGYGALVLKYASINSSPGLLVGARGGWIINHTFSLGLAGYGLATNVKANVSGPLGQDYVNFGYGGVDLEYIVDSDRLVHFSFHTLIGAGAVGFRYAYGESTWDDFRIGDNWSHLHDTFFVIEPGANLDLNITTWFRLSVGASYRHIAGVESAASTNSGLSGPSGNLSFRFGSF
jgi:hypothetical protein